MNASYMQLYEETRETTRTYIHPESGNKAVKQFFYKVELHQYHSDYGPLVRVLVLQAHYDNFFRAKNAVVNERRLLPGDWSERAMAIRHAIAAFDEMISYIEHTPAGDENFKYNENWG